MDEAAYDQENDLRGEDEHEQTLAETRPAEIAAQITFQIVHELHLDRIWPRDGRRGQYETRGRCACRGRLVWKKNLWPVDDVGPIRKQQSLGRNDRIRRFG